jgi:MYXO-CTERM domain-containing protein
LTSNGMVTPAPVAAPGPQPSSLALVGAGLFGLLALRRRQPQA